MCAAPVHVVAGVIRNEHDQILLARRPARAHQGGLWEFPGGKVEAGEAPLQALQRELHEELGIDVRATKPLIQVEHVYPDKHVLLDVFRVVDFTGVAHGREGQPVRWVAVHDLHRYTFPAANVPIIKALSLPDTYLITGGFVDRADFCARLESALRHGVRLVQLRAKQLAEGPYRQLAALALQLCRSYDARLVLNAAPELVMELGADGVHLSTQRLLRSERRPLSSERLVGASVHNAYELRQAEHIGADFVVIAPVLPTTSHPEAEPLGWEGFATLARRSGVPAFALGGLDTSMHDIAAAHGGQGIACIGALWGAHPIATQGLSR